ncbi:MAG: hypothetical protein AAF411_03820 [Myxococcota bacterium]
MGGATRTVLSFMAAVLAGACVDTALSLVVDVDGGSASATEDLVNVSIDASIRVGEFAVSGDTFTLPGADLFVGETPIAQLVLNRPEGFTNTLEPGQSTRVTITGMGRVTSDARATLCASETATVLLQWRAEEQPDDDLDPPLGDMGASEGTLTVTCPSL